jgi:hypothetical protein
LVLCCCDFVSLVLGSVTHKPFDMNCDFSWIYRAGDDDGGGGEDLHLAEPQLQGRLPEQHELRQRLQDGELPRRRLQDSALPTQVLLHKELLMG